MKDHRHASHYFVLPFDLCNEVLRGKYEKLVTGLADKLTGGAVAVFPMRPQVLNLPETENVAPTVELKVFAFSSTIQSPNRSEHAIVNRLKDLLYVPQAKADGTRTNKFRIEAHGLFAPID